MRSTPPRLAASLALTLALGFGCAPTETTDIAPTPPSTLTPKAVDETAPKPETPAPTSETKPEAPKTEPGKETTPAPAPEQPKEPAKTSDAGRAPTVKTVSLIETAPPAETDSIALIPVKHDEMIKRIADDTRPKYTVVDIWATWCGPCKENFPHVVQMHKKFADKGLRVISLSLDSPGVPRDVKEATDFLVQQKATFTNFLLDEEEEAAFTKLKLRVIPAVLVFGPGGKEIKRYTYDDPDNQFTYDEVEADLAALLAGKPLPSEAKKK